MEILYNDGIILVINKPAGLLIHRSNLSSDIDTLVDRFKALYTNPPSPVHRLDRPTSGIIISAFKGKTARTLGESFIRGDVKKKYMTIVRGIPSNQGEIDIALKKDGEGIFQDAKTSYRLLKKVELPIENNKYKCSRYSLLEVSPETGRFHQIRRHLARIGYPILGDTSHGDLRHNRIFKDYLQSERLLLHAEEVSFPHRESNKIITIKAPLPKEMNDVIVKLGW